MTYTTDERLKSYLDTNQLRREQMCLAVLAMDRRFSNVQPRHPRGGPDGGRDIQATFQETQLAFAAAGFMNQANDTDSSKNSLMKKFRDDLKSALSADRPPDVFVFFTNVNFTIGEKSSLMSEAMANGINYCDIYDRERIRIALDSADGFSIRFQYLGIPLSESEQATFFARWGDDIQSLISTGFEKVNRALDQMLFIQEMSRILDVLYVVYELDREYDGEEIGHLRAFFLMHLKEVKFDIFGILFGSYDKAGRGRPSEEADHRSLISGVKNGVGYSQWEQLLPLKEFVDPEAKVSGIDYSSTGYGSGIGLEKISRIVISYTHDQFIRVSPRITLGDLDQAMLLPVVNNSFAQKIKRINIIANGYILLGIDRSNMMFDGSQSNIKWPIAFDDEELKDVWVRIRPSGVSSNFQFAFSEKVPSRLYSSEFVPRS